MVSTVSLERARSTAACSDCTSGCCGTAATGVVVREIPTGWEANPEVGLQNLCSGGRAMAVSALGDRCFTNVPDGGFWIQGGVKGPTLSLESTPGLAADTGALRFELGAPGTTLYRVAPGRRPVRVGSVRGLNALAKGFQTRTDWIEASPDGRMLFVFVTYEEPFCPC